MLPLLLPLLMLLLPVSVSMPLQLPLKMPVLPLLLSMLLMRLPPLVCPLVFLCRLARSSCAAAGPSSGTLLRLLRRVPVDKGVRRLTRTGESRLRLVHAGRRRSCRQRTRALRKAVCPSFLVFRLGLRAWRGRGL